MHEAEGLTMIGGANSGRGFVVEAYREQRSPDILATTTLFHSVRAARTLGSRALGTVVRFRN
jgi:hypothetical protein